MAYSRPSCYFVGGMKPSTVVILDFGSQTTQLIARRIREEHVYSVILRGDAAPKEMEAYSPLGIILSGGPSSVYDKGSPQFHPETWAWLEKQKLPVLGICYGMQLLTHILSGRVSPSENREYGRQPIKTEKSSVLFQGLGPRLQVWMSHGDKVETLPMGFECVARSESGLIAAAENIGRRIYGLQFHPEVSHTEKGSIVLRNFVFNICGANNNWKMADLMGAQIAKIRAQMGENEHALCALSGGVDSAVAAELVHRAIGDRLHCVFVDNGLLRLNETARVMETFQAVLKLSVKKMDASRQFLTALAGVEDPEQKRKIIGREFISVFKDYAQEVSTRIGKKPKFLVQGTLYPDVIESSPAPSNGASGGGVGGKTGPVFSNTIKSHHNVGGLPKDLGFDLIEPLRDLFKDEVRELGRVLGVSERFLKRHPFPGPGLGVRVLGPIEEHSLDVLRRVDDIFIQMLLNEGLYDQIWQAFAVFLPLRSVGVQGDGRTHKHVVGLRAVTSQDGMTADWFPFTHDFLARVSNRICNEVHEVGRVVYDISSKPPATIEWE